MTAPQTRRSQPGEGWLRGNTHNTSRPNHSIAVAPLQHLLGRLDGVITTGKGHRACCPSCGGKSRKLAIAEGDNGTVLLHCFAGCTAHDVLAAVGLTVGDLFVRRDLRTMTPAERSQMRQAALLPRWKAALEVLGHEASVVLIAANKLGQGDLLDDEELTRMRISALRIFDAKEVLCAR